MAETEQDLIVLKNVTAGYPGNPILENLTFSVKKGEIFILLGGSGCGKSTVLKHMIGLNPALAGELRIAGEEWKDETRESLYRRIGVTYQSGALFGSMTCLENVLLPLETRFRLPKKELLARAMAQLEAVELADAANKMPSEISGGMRKRVALARAMVLEPEILFLDEPSAGLDPLTSAALDELILRLRKERNITFVVVTHELPSIFTIADRCVVFDKARRTMVALGTPRELANNCPDKFVHDFFNRGGLLCPKA